MPLNLCKFTVLCHSSTSKSDLRSKISRAPLPFVLGPSSAAVTSAYLLQHSKQLRLSSSSTALLHQEDFYQFKLKLLPNDISDMWDDLYMDTVASGKYALAPYADLQLVPTVIETQAEESSSGNDSGMEAIMNYNLDDDADTLTPLGDPDESMPSHPVGSLPSQPVGSLPSQPVGSSKKASKVYTPSFA